MKTKNLKHIYFKVKMVKNITLLIVKIIENTQKKSEFRKKITPHLLRYGFTTTHLPESGKDLKYIQVLFDHSSIRTTEIYTQVTINNIKTIKSLIGLLNLD